MTMDIGEYIRQMRIRQRRDETIRTYIYWATVVVFSAFATLFIHGISGGCR